MYGRSPTRVREVGAVASSIGKEKLGFRRAALEKQPADNDAS
jgi:hypothetical protein